MDKLGQCSVMKEITKTEEAINVCYDRVEILERKLKNLNESGETYDTTRKELAEVRKLLATNQKLLSTLHQHNRKSFVFGAVLVLIIFLVYMFYILVMGPDF